MAKKAKKRTPRMPPLSFVDKLICWTIFILLCASYVALIFGPMSLRSKIAFSDQAVIAMDENASMLWILVPWMTFFLMTSILWLLAYQARKPIFGRKNFKYGPPAWPKEYPLFMKNKPAVWVSERKKKQRKKIAIILLIVLLVSFIPFPLALYGRVCLCSNGNVVQYNMFNKQMRQFAVEEISEVEFDTYSYRNHRSATRHWSIQMIVKTDIGERYIFEYSDFRSSKNTETLYGLEAMLSVKERYNPHIIHYDGTEQLNLVIEDKNFNQKEIEKLYRLFDQAD